MARECYVNTLKKSREKFDTGHSLEKGKRIMVDPKLEVGETLDDATRRDKEKQSRRENDRDSGGENKVVDLVLGGKGKTTKSKPPWPPSSLRCE